MNLGGWGVQAFITYFFISYIYYVLFIKRVYENHMIMCDGYIMLTFFISTHLINRNNCVASKQASKQADLYIFCLYDEPVRGGFPPRTGSSCLRTAYAGKVIPPTRHAKPGMARESRRTTSWQQAGKVVSRLEKGCFDRSDTRPCSVRHQTSFGVGPDGVRCRSLIFPFPAGSH